MRIFLDTDVLMDVALAREPHWDESAAVLGWARDAGRAAIAWHSLTNCAYLLKGGRKFLKMLLEIVDVAPVGTVEARQALALSMPDVEDAFQAAAAFSWKADFLITRNLRDYRRSPVPAISPAAFLKIIHS